MPDGLFRLISTNSETFSKIEKDDNALYFLSDTGEIYKGDKCFTSSVLFVSEFPTSGIVPGKVYFNTETEEAKVYTGTEWVSLSSNSGGGSINWMEM